GWLMLACGSFIKTLSSLPIGFPAHCRRWLSRERGVKRVHGCMRSTARISRKTSEFVCGRGIVSTGVPCTRKRSIDQVDGNLERGVYIQIRSIEQVRVRGPAQGRRSAVLVAFVAAADIAQHLGFAHVDSGQLQLKIAPPGALLRGRCH